MSSLLASGPSDPVPAPNRPSGDASGAWPTDIVDAFFEDVDHSIRELGIGDMGVPKRMKKLARMFYGRANSYGEALDAG